MFRNKFMRWIMAAITMCVMLASPFAAYAVDNFSQLNASNQFSGEESLGSVNYGDELSHAWLKANFPKLRGLTTEETVFVFRSAPKSIKTRAVLNKKGETLTLHCFENSSAFALCQHIIKGNTFVYGNAAVYVDTEFPATYYV